MVEVTNNAAWASWYRMTGVVFRENARVLYRAFEDKGEPTVGNPMAVPLYYLISHAAELFLKCALLKRDFSPEMLKSNALRHSLEGLLRELLKKGVPISEPCLQLLVALSHQHEKHALRYSVFVDDGQPTFTPEPEELFSMLDELLMAGRITTHGV
jgi:HEPN domain-containing protein